MNDIVFSDLQAFASCVNDYFGSDEEYARFTRMLVENPQAGDVIVGACRARKVRYPDVIHRKGTRGGLRVIYFYFPQFATITCVAIYRKSEKVDLTVQEKRAICVLSDKLLAIEANKRKG